MKAIVLTGYGDVDCLELRDMPEPHPAAGEIRVRVAAASINPIDWKMRRGDVKNLFPLKLPAILGRDVSGEVVEVGPGVTAFKVGDRVMGLVNGGYAEQVVSPVEAWARVPPSLDLTDAAALPLVALTGTQLVEEAVNPSPGDIVLVTGALGGVGRAALHAAKLRGAKVWAGVRAKQKADAARLGADGVVALDDPADLDRLPTLDAIADTLGGSVVARLLSRVKPGGTIGSVVGEPPGAKEKGLKVHAIVTHPDSQRLAKLGEDVAKGELVIPIGKRMPLAETRDAQKLAERGGAGKVLLVP
ncbi:NADP-dependent oxidoreductase [Myxococcus landrumensis]|uniref:NADP-dependent oxidoreductase n=1 Tax=Myxococcus landrumensis TaxID=2813577 RepID=A0ABX7NC77_9BACT|nr:NADP-dependent oxidoreductase [Myxococcus landrumus]QSQ16018.1 NADP-dependent oxidoreductase [Myxococcus landrumus]